MQVILKQVEFQKNKALENGGAIYAKSYLNQFGSYFLMIFLENCNFIKNGAYLGPSVYSQNLRPQLDSLTVENMKSSENESSSGGSQIQYNPVRLEIAYTDQILQDIPSFSFEAKQYQIKEFRSGDEIKQLIFILRDENNKQIKFKQDKQNPYSIQYNITSSSYNMSSFQIKQDSESNDFNYYEGQFIIKNIILVGLPGEKMTLSFYQQSIKIVDNNQNLLLDNYKLDIEIQFRQCKQGEEILKYYTFTECKECDEKMFSFDAQRCIECPQGAGCNGSKGIVALSGYWRKDENSTTFQACKNLDENCIGGQFGDKICFEGHIGALCEQCDIKGDVWGKAYTRSSSFSCIGCDLIDKNTWIITLSTLYALLSIFLAIKGDISQVRKNQINRFTKSIVTSKSLKHKNSSIFISHTNDESEGEQKTGLLIKIFTNYFQIVSCISTFNLSLPSVISSVPSSIGQPISQTSHSLDCLLIKIDTDIPIIYLKLFFSQILPICYFLCILIGLIIKSVIQKKKQLEWHFIYSALLFIIIYVHPDIIGQLIALISCRQIGDYQYIIADVSYECFTDQYYQYTLNIVLPLLILWVLAIPFYLFQRLYSYRDQLHTNKISSRFGILYKEYTQKAYYWEFIKMFEKIAIIIVLNAYLEDIYVKGFIILGIIFLYGSLSSRVKPYEEESVNRYDKLSTSFCFTTVIIALFLHNNSFDYLQIIGYILMATLNAYFIFVILHPILLFYFQKIRNSILILSSKYPRLKTIFNLKPNSSNHIPSQTIIQSEQHKLLFYRIRRKIRAFINLTKDQKISVLQKLRNNYEGEAQTKGFKKQQIDQNSERQLEIIKGQDGNLIVFDDRSLASEKNTIEMNHLSSNKALKQKSKSTIISLESNMLIDFSDRPTELNTRKNIQDQNDKEKDRSIQLISLSNKNSERDIDPSNRSLTMSPTKFEENKL